MSRTRTLPNVQFGRARLRWGLAAGVASLLIAASAVPATAAVPGPISLSLSSTAPAPSPSSASTLTAPAPSPSPANNATPPAPTPTTSTSATPVPAPTSATAEDKFLAAIGPAGASMGDGVRKYQGKTTAGAAALSTGGAASTGAAAGTAGTWMPSGVQGLDVSVHQATKISDKPVVYEDRVDWAGQKAKGAQFAYVKATEGDYYRNPMWQSQFNNTYNAGMIRGSYHFAIPHPDAGTAADQARYFAANGGVWSADGKTLPPLLDIEYNPYVNVDGVNYFGNTCYDRTPEQMVAWIREFSDTVYALKGRLPAIYTTTDWWTRCVGNNGGFSGNPLHIASYYDEPTTSPGVIPNGWVGHDIWQYSSIGPFVGDSNVWRGTLSQLQAFATGVTVNTSGAIGQTWVAAGGAGGSWGQATSEERCDASLCLQVFERRMAYWTAQRGVLSVATSGAIGSVWRSAGAAASRFGLPTGSEGCTGSYCLQNFQTGDLYWSASTGVQSVYYGTDNSTIGAYWKKQGGPSSKYGLPTSSESCASSYCVQYFERGSIYWTSGTGIQPVFTAGDNSTVGGAWIKLGGVNSKFGFPTSSEQCYSNYCEQTFQKGRILWNVDVGVQAVFTNGDNSTIGGLWVKAGATTSRYGFPIGPETCTSSSCQQRFQFGTIVWSPAGGVQPLFYSTDNSTVAAYFTLNLGGTAGKYGFPISADTCQAESCVQKFQFGNVYWTPSTGIQPVFTNGDNSTVGGAWMKLGGVSSKFGFPTAAEKCYSNYCEQLFQRGRVL